MGTIVIEFFAENDVVFDPKELQVGDEKPEREKINQEDYAEVENCEVPGFTLDALHLHAHKPAPVMDSQEVVH